MTTMKRRWQACALLLALAGSSSAFAAGGHHAVDDAAILEPGECELEGWGSRATGGERLLHAGGNCRVGPIELGASGEYARFQGESATGWGLEAKWAGEVATGVSLGVSVVPAWQARVSPRYQGTLVNGLATWTPAADWAFHANFGRAFVREGDNENRYGVAAEWTVRPGWTLMTERYREESTHFVRAGVRWEAGKFWSVDLSRAQRLAGEAPSNWTVGLTLGFGD